MKFSQKILFLSAMWAMPLSAAYAQTYTEWATANRIIVQSTRTDIYLNTTIPNPAGCAIATYVALPDTTPNFDVMTAAAMTALAGQFEVRISVDETTCFTNRTMAVWVSFRN